MQDIDPGSYIDCGGQEALNWDPERVRTFKVLCRTAEEPRFRPRTVGAFWQCTCGTCNAGEACMGCGLQKERVFAICKEEAVDTYLAKQKERAEKNRKSKKRAAIAAAVLICVPLIGLLAFKAGTSIADSIEEKRELREEEKHLQNEQARQQAAVEAILNMSDGDFQAEFEEKALEYMAEAMRKVPDYLVEYDGFAASGAEMYFTDFGAIPCGSAVADGVNRYTVMYVGNVIRGVYRLDEELYSSNRYLMTGKLPYNYLLYIKHDGDEYITPYYDNGVDYTGYRYIAGLCGDTIYFCNGAYSDIGMDAYDLYGRSFQKISKRIPDQFEHDYIAFFNTIEENYTRANVTFVVRDHKIYALGKKKTAQPTRDGRLHYDVFEYDPQSDRLAIVGGEFH